MDDFLIPSPEPPRNLDVLFQPLDTEIENLLEVATARETFKVSGSGLTVCVLDTGLRVSHSCFAGRVVAARNFTTDDAGALDVVTDKNGHGTNVTGLIAASSNDERRGVAPGCNIVALKVIPAPTIQPIVDALKWVDSNSSKYGISVVNISLGARNTNYLSDEALPDGFSELATVIRDLTAKNIAVVAAAGNDFYRFQVEGMGIPAILREIISVGAVYDASFGPRSYKDGAVASSTRADQITPYTQRLSQETSPDCYMDVLSTGGAAVSAGSASDDASSVQDGTSQASPTVAGIVLLLQEYFLRHRGALPAVATLQEILRSSSTWLVDAETAEDNVTNTNRRFPRVNALQSLSALHSALVTGKI